MLNKNFRIALFGLLAIFIALASVSCMDDLNTSPIDDSVVTSANVYETPDDYRQVLAKLYSGLAATGQQGPDGMPDIDVPDEGFSSYLRQLWVHQTITTDEGIVGWDDDGLPEYNYQAWTPSNNFLGMMYDRIYYQIVLTNEFIRQSAGRDEQVIREYVAEARFLRALSYWHAMDLFGGNIPFVTENSPVGAFMPEPTTNTELFEFIENELLEIEENLQPPRQNEYGRVDRGAVWTLLSKLYLNAEVYVDNDRYDDARLFTEKVINEGGYNLAETYQHLFMADNDRPGVKEEVIFPIRFDGNNLQTWGGTTFIVRAAVGGDMSAAQFGIGGGWVGHRTTPQFVEKFAPSEDVFGITSANTGGFPEIYVPGGYQESSGYTADWSPADAPPLNSENNDDVYTGLVYFAEPAEYKFTSDRNWDQDEWGGSNGVLVSGGPNILIEEPGLYTITVDLNNMTYQLDQEEMPNDSREMFFTDGQSLEIESIQDFNQGYAISKWTNMRSTGSAGSNNQHVDTDFPLFRLADIYLMYAEATLRSNGNTGVAVDLINELRNRAYGNQNGETTGHIDSGDLTLEFILEERARELYWEGHRRTDLRRFGKFTGGDYLWSWKGGSQEGSATNDRYEIFPIPSSDINSNLNLTQNPGY